VNIPASYKAFEYCNATHPADIAPIFLLAAFQFEWSDYHPLVNFRLSTQYFLEYYLNPFAVSAVWKCGFLMSGDDYLVRFASMTLHRKFS